MTIGRASKIVITVPDMHRRHDVRTVSARIADVSGVSALQVDLVTKTVTVEGYVSVGDITRAIAGAGYAVTGART